VKGEGEWKPSLGGAAASLPSPSVYFDSFGCGQLTGTVFGVGSAPNLRPYDALQPNVSLFAKNTATAPMAAESLSIDFSKPDRIPMALMNEIIWKSVMGAGSQVPATQHSLGVVDADG
jgi:hypothetical protein